MQASKKFYNKCSENSRSQIVFRTDIFRKLTLGAPEILGKYLPIHSCLSSITFNYITFFSIIRYACAIVGYRSALPYASSKTCCFPAKISNYFQTCIVLWSGDQTSHGDDLELQLAGTRVPKSRIFSFTLFRLLAVFFTVCSGLVLMVRIFLCRKFKLKEF